MARPSLRRDRAERRRSEAAVKLIVFGVALIVAPAFVGKAFNALIPVGLLMLVAGGIFVWVGRMRLPPTTNPRTPTAPRHRPDQRMEPTGGGLAEIREIFEVEGPRSSTSRPTSWSTEVFNVIEWRRFEGVVEALFQQAGFETRSQSHGADDGIDVWLYSRNHPGSPVSIVQCKHWSGKRVGVDKIRELRGVMASKGVQRGQFATTSTFTPGRDRLRARQWDQPPRCGWATCSDWGTHRRPAGGSNGDSAGRRLLASDLRELRAQAG